MDKLIFPPSGNQRIYNWLFLALLAAVIAIKFNDLSLPFFWDELGVYGHGVAYQYEHGLSLMPDSVPNLTSRGHPLMFTFLNALAWKIFGQSVFVAHAFALFIALCLLTTVYSIVKKQVSALAGFVAATVLAVQPLFLAQSAMVLPEIMLTLFALSALSAYYEGKHFQFAFFASLGILTKESAIVLPLACISFSLLQSVIWRKTPKGLQAKNLLLTLVPYIVFGIFLLVQKSQNGWYFFPYHIGSMKMDWQNFTNQFSAFFDDVFWMQGRYWSEKILLISVFILLLTGRLNFKTASQSFFMMLGIFMLGFMCFGSISIFYMDRYMFAVLTGSCMLTGAAFTAIIKNKFIVFSVLFFLCWIGFNNWENKSFNYDSDLGYRKPVHTLQQAINYTAVMAHKDETAWGNFPAFFALNYSEAGYLTGLRLKSANGMNDSPAYFIYCSPGDNLQESIKSSLQQLKEFQDGFAISRVYRINHN